MTTHQDDLFGRPGEPVKDPGVAARLARLDNHPTVQAARAMSERVAAAKAEAAERAARDAELEATLPPALAKVERNQRVQHRRSGWVGMVSSIAYDGSEGFVKVEPQGKFVARFSAWFKAADLCEPQA